MKKLLKNSSKAVAAFGVMAALSTSPVYAGGAVGGHVNDLKSHLNEYTEEVKWLIGKVDGIVDTYESKGSKTAKASAVVDHWEAVDFHAAIETNYIQIYAYIWQGLFGVKEAIEANKPIAEVRQEQEKLEQALWQALGAVKLASQYQERGLLAKVQTTAEARTPVETLVEINQLLDRSVAKFAEQLPEEATNIVHDTYLNLFEGVEGVLIEQDANLVEDLEKDFNVTLPKALKADSTLDDIRKVVQSMQAKIDKARALLVKAEKNKKDVF